MRSIKPGSLLVALLAALALGACGSSDIGDILGGPSGRAPNQLKGIVRAVDATGGDCRIELDNTTQTYLDNRDSGYGGGNRATIYCDNNTRVVFQGQTYRPESLENGDEVIAAVRDVGGRLIADRIDVTYDVSSGGRYGDDTYSRYPQDSRYPQEDSRYPQDDRYDQYGSAIGEDVRGTVRRVDTTNRSLTLERVEYVDRGLDRGSDLLTLYFDTDTEVSFRGQSYRPENLEVGDVVAVDVDTVRGTLVADDIRVLADARGSAAAYPPR